MPTAIRGHISNERLLHISLWFAQGLVGLAFAALALLKLLSERDRLVEIMSWTENTPLWFVYALGTLELVASFVVAVPAVTRITQRIVGFTAAAFTLLMSVGTLMHLARGELRLALVTLAIGLLAGFVAWGRLTHSSLETVEHSDLVP